MEPQKDKPEPRPAEKPPETDLNRTNGAGSFPEPQPVPITPELLEEIRHLWTEEDERLAAEGMREIMAGGGVRSEEFLRFLDRMARGDG
jgi:hypothetical protein